MKRLAIVLLFFIAFNFKHGSNIGWNAQWNCELYPPEHKMSVDPTTGAQNGRWVAADNWYGDIAIIDAKTSHLRWLTKGHRIYGDVRVLHPHVGWAPDSKSVEFTSHLKGNSDVCIAHLPEEWDEPFVQNSNY